MNGAVFSACRTWRYTLTRDLVPQEQILQGILDGDPSIALFILLNPSTADEAKNDPTVTRCINFAKLWGYSRLVVCNAFAIRSTDPKVLYKTTADVVGPDNDRHIMENARSASMIVVAWGVHGAHLSRGQMVLAKLRREGLRVHHLGLTKDKHPRHPLYLRSDTVPTILWE